MDDAIWDYINSYNVSLDNMNGTEALANIDGTKESIATSTTLTSSVYDEIWYNTHEEYDSWHDILETINVYQEWDDPPNILEDTSPNYESASKHINQIFILVIIKPKYGTFEAGYFTVYHRISYPSIHVQQVHSSYVILYLWG